MFRMYQHLFSRCTHNLLHKRFSESFATLCKILFWGPVTNEVLHGLKSISEEGEPERIIVTILSRIVAILSRIVTILSRMVTILS